MRYSKENLGRIFERTDGRCHLYGKKRAFKNYARFGKRGNWEVDHLKPRANGGTDHLSNLYVACISHNRSKGRRSAKEVRAKHGLVRRPMSRRQRERQEERKFWDVVLACGALAGGVVLLALIADGADMHAPTHT